MSSFDSIEMPLLEHSVRRHLCAGNGFKEKFAVVGVQHLLAQSVPLVRAMHQLGIAFENIYLAGKYYSSNQAVVGQLRKMGVNIFDSAVAPRLGHFQSHVKRNIDDMWTAFRGKGVHRASHLLLLDDGGRVLSSVPHEVYRSIPVVGVEQTSSGHHQHGIMTANFPIVSVARSDAKLIFEAPFIGESIVENAEAILPNLKNLRVGVLGFGSIGKAVAAALERRNLYTSIYDSDPVTLKRSQYNVLTTASELVNRCDVIFGCTGRDVLKSDCFRSVNDPRFLFSGSSEDTEFNSLLAEQVIQTGTKQSELTETNVSGVFVGRRGFPINFDRQPISLPIEHIQLTVALLLEGLVQSASYYKLGKIRHIEKINPETQNVIVKKWLEISVDSYSKLLSWGMLPDDHR